MVVEKREHDWFKYKTGAFKPALICCRVCGVVKRADGKNKPCRGPVTVSLRSDP